MCRTELKTYKTISLFFIFAKILFFAIALSEAETAAGMTEENADDAARLKPGYDVPMDARDPFAYPLKEKKDVLPETDLTQNKIAETLRLSLVSSSPVGNFAIVNNQLIQEGQVINADLSGKQIAMTVLTIDPSAQSLILSYEDKEFIIRSNQINQ